MKPPPPPPLDVAAIRTPDSVGPSAEAEAFSLQEFLDLTPTGRLEHEHRALIRRLDALIKELRGESAARLAQCDALGAELAVARVTVAMTGVTRRGDRWKDALTAAMALAGGGLISSYPRGSGWFAFGWSLLAVASLFQFGRAGFNTP